MTHDLRWKQRFQNFDRAVVLLRQPIDRGVTTLSDLEREGTVRRFKAAIELAWKTLNDYLEHEGKTIQPITPRAVIKDAFAAGIVGDGSAWIAMLDHRNLLSHSYDATTLENAVVAVRDRYLPAIEELHAWFTHRMNS